MEQLLDSISKDILELNQSWYESKSHYFKKEPFYEAKLDKIYTVVENKELFIMPDDEIEEITTEIVVEKDINDYCWNCLFYGSSCRENYEFGGDISELPIDGYNISARIIRRVKKHSAQFIDPNAINNLLTKVLNRARDLIKELLEKTSIDTYKNVLQHFHAKFQTELLDAFRDNQNQVDLLESKDNLEFNLKQEELAALLFILNKAEFLNTTGVNDTTFLRFCQKYFYFKLKEVYVQPSSEKSFTDKYREFLRGEHSDKAFEVVRKKIITAIEAFKKGD